MRFRCHTGHAYSADSLLAEFTEKTEESLWSTIRLIEETVLLMRGMAEHLHGHNHAPAAEKLLRKAHDAQQRAELIRQAAMRHENLSVGKL